MVSLFVLGCSPDTPSGNSSDAVKSYPGELSKAEYDALNDEQKYQVANKLLGTMFKGVPVDEFFDISNGMQNLTLKSGNNFFSNTKVSMTNELTQDKRNELGVIIAGYDDVGDENDVDGLFNINVGASEDSWPKDLALGRINQYPISKDMFDHWVAYVLVNTILFSPAEEIDSASERDVQKVYYKLVDDLRANKTIQQVIARHQRTQENWRRFRPPEDNTREMIEIYLGLFDRDEDVPRASIACQDLYLSDEDDGYELLTNSFFNTEPQYVLDTFVTTCGDFYDVVANHPLVVPRMVTVIVDYLFNTRPGDERAAIIDTVLSGGPSTFQDIFKSIVFSKEYLTNTERPLSFEENFFNISKRLDWEPHSDLLQDITDENSTMSIKQMDWPSMSNKLGRLAGVPLDSLSFANYHRAMRDALYLDGDSGDNCVAVNNNNTPPTTVQQCRSCGGNECKWKYGMGLEEKSEPTELPIDPVTQEVTATEQQQSVYNFELANYNRYNERFERVQALSLNDFIDYVFMSALSRRASGVEKTDLLAMFVAKNYVEDDGEGNQVMDENDYSEATQLMLDYVSRLEEAYYSLKIN